VARLCVPSSLFHLLRSLPPDVTIPHATAFDKAIYQHVLTLLKRQPKDPTYGVDTPAGDAARLVMHLHPADGGLGITSLAQTAVPAHAGSCLLTAPLIAARLGTALDPALHGTTALPGFAAILAAHELSYPTDPKWPFNSVTISTVFTGSGVRQAQAALTRRRRPQYTAAALTALRGRPAGDGFQAAANVRSHGGAGAILIQASPKSAHKHIPDRDFSLGLLMRMGLPLILPPGGPGTPMPICEECSRQLKVITRIDAYGYHAAICAGNSSNRTNLHTALVDKLLVFFKKHAQGAADGDGLQRTMRTEQNLLTADGFEPKPGIKPEFRRMRGDIAITSTNRHGNTNTVILDVTVKVPTVSGSGNTEITGPAYIHGAAAHVAHQEKLAKYEGHWNYNPRLFQPLAMETYGTLHPSVPHFIADYLRPHFSADANLDSWDPQLRKDYSCALRDIREVLGLTLARQAITNVRFLMEDARHYPVAVAPPAAP
jgi:hypothetical protein